ncbi:MAG: endolytic transglycosylase MltG [Acidobacteria bacterium]|nr:endolytic transglycosylase MltG [Acidobacteriota bacterium]NIM60532.1 endolytic transglycosylase MltG [Acidobacteriota bacterium]NIO59503.1 endolytic transglycosylase MltG [Acidobacteriota bacterium]NIQ30532.1 endolytic transglycosylase MltG [Acidobacteriota bacterium]NIQ85480.1 endolytic transglycosylase MltG [Acidobacteriota bacterium]
MKHRLIRLAVGAALVVVLIAAAGAGWFFQQLRRPYAAWPGEYVDVILEPGISASAMLKRLGDAGVLERPRIARAYLSWTRGGALLQAGEYRFDEPAGPFEILARLRAGDVLLHEVTVPEGLDLTQVATTFAAAGFADEESLLAAFANPEGVAEQDADATDLEGYLFPDTYRFSRDATADAIAARMLEQFRAAVGEDYAERAEAVGLTLRQAVTLASLIEEETSVPDERKRISAVFHNRLKRRIPLQCDPTVLYALKREGQPVARLYSKHLKFDSPYNTYRYGGLPPGPIANPGQASLDAAVDPIESRELYFVALPGRGGHAFSETLEQHNRAVARWRAYERSSR